MTTSRIDLYPAESQLFAGEKRSKQPLARNVRACSDVMRTSRCEIGFGLLDDLRPRGPLSPQPLEIVELANLRSEHVDDHVAGINHHPVAIGQAFDMDLLDA